MTMLRRFLSLAALALVSGTATAEAHAQSFLRAPQPQFGGRLILDGYLSQYDLALADARARLDGVGARVMVALAPTSTPRRERLVEHLAVGGFVGSTSEKSLNAGSALRTSVYGAQIDLRPLHAAVGGVLEPVLSLGAGAIEVQETHIESVRLANGSPLLPRDVPLGTRPTHLTERETHPIVAPAVGVLLSPTPGFALRIDARRLISTEDRAGRSSELAAGVSITL
jgi:hypothetical protein